MSRVGRHARGRSAPAGRSARLPWVLWGAGVLAVVGGLVAIDRVWLARERVDASDPAVRVAGAVRSISGSGSVRSATYDPTAKTARIEVTSRYYDAAKPVAENREYLATEGRLGAQLALFGNTPVQEVTILLYARRTLLATVTARQGQKYDKMSVEYGGPVVRQ